MPNVKNSRVGGADDFYVRPHILSIQHHIFAAPSGLIEKFPRLERSRGMEGKAINSPDNFLVEAADFKEVRAVLAGHAIAEVTPKARISRYHKLICLGRQLFALQRVDDVRIV